MDYNCPDPAFRPTLFQRLLAWSVHLITASGAVFGLFALYAISEGYWLPAFWLMGGAVPTYNPCSKRNSDRPTTLPNTKPTCAWTRRSGYKKGVKTAR